MVWTPLNFIGETEFSLRSVTFMDLIRATSFVSILVYFRGKGLLSDLRGLKNSKNGDSSEI